MEGTQMSADLAIIPPRAAAERGPAAEARHLHPAALPQWRALLEFHWRERLERITEYSLAYHGAEEAAADASRGRDARLAARRRASQILHQTVAERRALAEIEAALARLATGRFGWCEQCHRVIGTARLSETPHRRYCTACDG
jgi:DnaK suppressor protein